MKIQKNWQKRLPKRLQILIGSSVAVIAFAAICSVIALHISTDHLKAKRVASANSIYKIADILASRPDSTLVSSKHMLKLLHSTLKSKQHTLALDTCPSANDAVVKKLQKQSTAVLIHINNHPGPHQCTLAQIVEAYGRPNASTTLSGKLTDPHQVLLYYDKGPGASGPLKPVSPPQAPATVVPIALANLPSPVCPGRTVLSYVAHEDDDILFMNPDHQKAIRGGACLRTVFLTAGDDGLGRTYWLGREKGAEAAYDAMIGRGASLWIERYVLVNNHEYIKMASPRGNPNITLVFVGLADGNVSGGGFARNKYESLSKLASGAIGTMHSVDGQSSYSKGELIDLLARLMRFYRPNEINTQTPIDDALLATDHSDHKTTGQFTAVAMAVFGQNVSLRYYTGYPISRMPQNVAGQDAADKTAVFNAYASYDNRVCLNPADCSPSGPYASWEMRQYTYTPGQPLFQSPPASTPVAPVPTPSSPPSSTTDGSTTPNSTPPAGSAATKTP